jgi:hypothetical protein
MPLVDQIKLGTNNSQGIALILWVSITEKNRIAIDYVKNTHYVKFTHLDFFIANICGCGNMVTGNNKGETKC